MADTTIEWADKVWNCVRGCAKLSEGCRNCYAMRMAHRFSGKGQPYEGLTRLTSNGPAWTGRARFVPEMLAAPLHWRKPARIFVNSMGDLFHDDITNEQITAVFGVMAACPQHTFIVLTKRPERMLEWFKWAREMGDRYTCNAEEDRTEEGIRWATASMCNGQATKALNWQSDSSHEHLSDRGIGKWTWPLPNVWLGVSCENQATADFRIPLLFETPAAVRVLSIEPMLGPVDLRGWGEAAPSKPGKEWNNVTWDNYVWEDWIPVELRKLITDFWSDSYGRSPESWLKDHVIQMVPRTGARVTFGRDGDSWLTTDKMAADGVTGRYVHLWNNIGRVVANDGSVHCTAGGYGSGWLSKWYDRGDYRAKLHSVIVGCESGPGSRPMDLDWVRSIRDQCEAAKVPFFFKQAVTDGRIESFPLLDGRMHVELPRRCAP